MVAVNAELSTPPTVVFVLMEFTMRFTDGTLRKRWRCRALAPAYSASEVGLFIHVVTSSGVGSSIESSHCHSDTSLRTVTFLQIFPRSILRDMLPPVFPERTR